MENIHVVLDSTANVPVELLQKFKNLHKVSLKLIIGEKEWNEDDLSSSQLFEEMKHTDVFPRTSQPPLGEFVKLFEPIIADGGKIIVLTVSGGLSGTVEGAKTAARMVNDKNIYVIDTKTAVLGIVNMAEQALAMIEDGLKIEDIVEKLNKIVEATHTILLPDSLEYLHKGGRIGGAAAIFGTLFQIKPVLYLVDGKVAVLDKVRTRSRAITRMIDEVKKCDGLAYIGVVHSGVEEDGLKVKERLEEIYPECKISVNEVSSALAIHAGPAALAFMYQEKLR